MPRIRQICACVAAPDGDGQVLAERGVRGRDAFERALDAFGYREAGAFGVTIAVTIRRASREASHELGGWYPAARPAEQDGKIVKALRISQTDDLTVEGDGPVLTFGPE